MAIRPRPPPVNKPGARRFNMDIIIPDFAPTDHIGPVELKNWLESLTPDPATTRHLADCERCREELAEVFHDLTILKGMPAAGWIQKMKVEYSQARAGFRVAAASIFFPEALPVMRGENSGKPEELMRAGTFLWLNGTIVRLSITRAEREWEMELRPLGKFDGPVGFFLYNDGKMVESIALKGRQTGRFQNLKPGRLELKKAGDVLFLIDLEELPPEQNP